jgi:hypothetical protein
MPTDDDAERALKLANFRGLSGMQDLIDARVPTGLVIRGGVRLEEAHSDLHGHMFDFSQEKIDLQAYAGVAAFSLFEVGARLPFEIDHTTKTFSINGGATRRSGDQFGDLDLAGKLSLKLGWFALAPYAQVTLPSGDRRFDHSTGAELGGAVSAALLQSRVVLHANVSGQFIDTGNWALNFRGGVSVVPLASKVLVLRPYIYLDGHSTFIGRTGSDLSVAAGAQALLLDFIQVEAGASYRFLANGGNGPARDGPSNDTGTWSLSIGAGVAF